VSVRQLVITLRNKYNASSTSVTVFIADKVVTSNVSSTFVTVCIADKVVRFEKPPIRHNDCYIIANNVNIYAITHCFT